MSGSDPDIPIIPVLLFLAILLLPGLSIGFVAGQFWESSVVNQCGIEGTPYKV